MPIESSDKSADVRHARDSLGRLPDEGALRQISELARELQAEPNMPAMLRRIVTATVAEVDGAAHGGITIMEGRTVRAVAATDPIVERMDQRQNDLNEGPCLTSLREEVTVRSDDFATEQRWPKFVAAALDEGIGSMLSVQLFVEGENLGALNLYAMSANAFSSSDESTAMALASHAAVAVKGGRNENNLRTALGSRDVIGQGKGILMERLKISPDEAFALMVMASQQTNRKLREVAEELATSGELRAG